MEGLDLFVGKAKCGDCHVPPDFTDFTYDNIGIPRNLLNPFYYEPEWNTEGILWTDYGLGGFLMKAGEPANVYKSELGKFKVPTLRNVGKGSCEEDPSNPDCIMKAYGHNGYFKSLKGIVHFYNTRDTLPTCNPVMYPIIVPTDYDVECWPEPEVRKNMNRAELGNLGLTPDEEDDIVAFLMTLSDGYEPSP